MKAKSGDFVLPGDFLGVSEEFVPAEGAYDDEGDIKAMVVGTVSLDDKNKRIFVVPQAGSPPVLKKNTTIIGHIMEVRGQRALVKIHAIKDNPRKLVVSFVGGIHVSQAEVTDKKSDLRISEYAHIHSDGAGYRVKGNNRRGRIFALYPHVISVDHQGLRIGPGVDKDRVPLCQKRDDIIQQSLRR